MLELAFPSISATALFLLALYNRYAAIVSRIRSMDRERISPHPSQNDVLLYERLKEENEYQTKMLLVRAKMVRRAIGLLMLAMMLFALQGFLAALQTLIIISPGILHACLVLLMAGFWTMVFASVSAAYEVYLSLQTVSHEAELYSQF